MKRRLKYYRLIFLKHDLPAGLSVFLVALPLCLGIALASHAPLYAGLLSGVIGGLIVSLVSGSSLGVSGPAAGLAGMISGYIITLGNFKVLLLAIIIAGLFQLLLGIFKLGVIANYFPSSVIKGMLAAIGILLIVKQIPVAIGYDKPDYWSSDFFKIFSKENMLGNLSAFNHHATMGAVIIFFVSLVVLIVMQQPFAKKFKTIPAPLLAVLAGVVTNIIFTKLTSGLSLKATQLVFIPANIFGNVSLPDFKQLFATAAVWKAGILIGLLATLETLLCVEAIDKLDRHNRITPVNRELVAQGLGNMLCGLLGAIPITAVVVRGAANVDAGGRTKLSAFTHGLFLLLAVLLVPFLLNQIPYASLAAVLFVTGYNLTKPKLYINMWRLGFKQLLPFLLTIIFILFSDLLTGVCIGLLLSVFFIVQNNFRAEYHMIKEHHSHTDMFTIKLNTNVTFLNKVNLRKTLDKVPEYAVLTIDGSHCNFIDYDIREIISEYAAKAKDRHIELHLKGVETVDVMAVH